MNNQERLHKIIKALNELKEILAKKKRNVTKLEKAREAVKSAISPLKETYDFLSKTIGSNCSYVTRMCLENIRLTIRDYEGTDFALWGYPGLWDSLAKPEFISELERSAGPPRDLITLEIAVADYLVSRSTLKRRIKAKTIKSYRPKNSPKNAKHIVSRAEIEQYCQRKLR